MIRLPVLLVVPEGARDAASAALAAAGVPHCASSASEAAQAVSAGWAELVVVGRAPGWQALIARVEGTGAAAVLLGPGPTEQERRQLLPPELEAVAAPAGLIAALERAQGRAEARRQTGSGEHAEERARAAELVNRFAQSIATQLDLPQVVSEAIARTRDLCDADGASLLLVDPASGDLCFDTVAGGAAGAITRTRLRAGEGVAGQVALRAEPILVADARQHPRVARQFDASTGFTTASIIAVPLLLSGDVMGVLEAVRGAERPPFTRDHLHRLELLGPHVIIAVHHAQMTARLRESQAAVQRANEDLERKVQERTAQIARGKREWERTFDAISDPIALQDGFVIRRGNLAYARAVGLDVTQLSGRTCHQLLAGRDTPCPGCPLLGARAGGKLSAELSLRKTTYEFSGFWLSPDRDDDAVVVTYRDVGQQRALQARVRESERLASIGQLASGAAHEINNPMAFVTSNLNTLRQLISDLARERQSGETIVGDDVLEDGVAMVTEALDGAERVRTIVRALRELARQEIGREEPCDVNASVQRAIAQELQDVPARVETDLSATVRASIAPLQLDQALVQLLRNARQAIQKQGAIRVRTRADAASVFIVVEDDGHGIAPEHLPKVFDPFFTTRGVGAGVGLGLTAAYGIVRRYGGTLEVQSTPGAGSAFTVRLARSPAASSPGPGPRPAGAPTSTTKAKAARTAA